VPQETADCQQEGGNHGAGSGIRTRIHFFVYSNVIKQWFESKSITCNDDEYALSILLQYATIL